MLFFARKGLGSSWRKKLIDRTAAIHTIREMEQDWTPVLLKRLPAAKTVAKFTINPEALRMRALDNDEVVKKRELTKESKKALMEMRIIKKLTQEQVDKLCGFPRNTIRDIECGKLVPSGAQMNLIQKQVGAVLKVQK